MSFKLYRFYIDESGDHTYSISDNPEERYLGLTGCIIESDYYKDKFHPSLEKFKQKHFPHDPDEPIILHRREIVNKRGPFWRLRDNQKEKEFNQDLITFFKESNFIIISVVIDKKQHKERYKEAAFHPYHFCLATLLERYCGYLHFYNAKGDVMAESRGKQEDLQLKEAYRRVYGSGTLFRSPEFFQKVLTSKEIKIKPKKANIPGLQLADLLAHPCKNEILIEKGIVKYRASFGREISKTVKAKYNHHFFDGRIEGYGKNFLG